MRRFEPEIVSLREWIAASATNFGKLRSFDIQSWQNLEGYLHQGDGRSYAWTWHTTLDPQAELTLRMSQWSSPRPDGTRVNYQGLGLAFTTRIQRGHRQGRGSP